MKKADGGWKILFAGIMLIFCAFLTVFVLQRASLDFQLEDLSRSLETSQGRERKQQFEFNEVSAELPLVRAELLTTQPQADDAAQMVRQLKEERKQLRAEKKELETALESAPEKVAEDSESARIQEEKNPTSIDMNEVDAQTKSMDVGGETP